ncbi:hypothetical protein H2200_008799 [Cladophialophora chaetospira]|uniref:Uncharacterized protein n=1 Tax=Cladophialophora chaetospira TaxID=386627 RepID=A0AA39CG15_9EURO|nr:hypothetical protein H2200_008799 [Cladophialophora chaetospira]
MEQPRGVVVFFEGFAGTLSPTKDEPQIKKMSGREIVPEDPSFGVQVVATRPLALQGTGVSPDDAPAVLREARRISGFLAERPSTPGDDRFRLPSLTKAVRKEDNQGHSLPNLGRQTLIAVASMLDSLRLLCGTRPLPAGVTRLEWTCRCGHRSYDDYLASAEAVNILATKMLSGGAVVRAETSTNAKSPLSLVVTAISNKFNAVRNVLKQRDVEDQIAPHLDVEMHELPGEAEAKAIKFVGICFQGRSFKRWLVDMQIVSVEPPAEVSNDRELFTILKYMYNQEWRSMIGVAVSSIHFVRFFLRPSSSNYRIVVDNIKEGEHPPRSNLSYEYAILDKDIFGKGVAPGSNWMKHLLFNPGDAFNDTTCLEAFPKKLEEKHAWVKGGKNIAWGVYLKTKPQKLWALILRAVSLLAAVVIVSTLALVDTEYKLVLGVIGGLCTVLAAYVDVLEELVYKEKSRDKEE